MYLLPINLILIFILTLKSISIIKQKKIDRIISIGGYMSLPIWLAAKFLSKKIDLCEPNLVLGKANKFYLNYAKNILTVLEEQSTGMVAAASEENKTS